MERLYYRGWSPSAITDLGFDRDAYERAHMLVRLIDGICRHPFLGPRLVLKGGAAINMFRRDLIRVPLDVDFGYVPRGRVSIAEEQPRFAEPLKQVVAALDMPRAMPVQGDINFLFRTPLWPTRREDSCVVAGDCARQVAIQSEYETAAAKLATVIVRGASRDLFDARELLRFGDLDRRKLRVAFVLYGVLQRIDWRTASISKIAPTSADVAAFLPQLRRDVRPAPSQVEAWTQQLIFDMREEMAALLAYEPHERAFLERVYTEGELAPELLTRDAELCANICSHPALAAKLRSIRRELSGDPHVEENPVLQFHMKARWRDGESDHD